MNVFPAFILLYTTGDDLVLRSISQQKIQMSLVIDYQLSELIKTTSYAINQILFQLPDLDLYNDKSWVKLFANLQRLYLRKLPIQISYFARFDQSFVGAEQTYARRLERANNLTNDLSRNLYDYRMIQDLDHVFDDNNLLCHEIATLDMKSRPWYQQFVNLTNPKIMWSPFFFSTNGIPSITASIPIYIANETSSLLSKNILTNSVKWNANAPRTPEHLFGVIGIQLNVKNISDILTESALRAGVAASFILNSEGQVVAATKLLRNNSQLSQETSDILSSEDLIDQLVNETLSRGFLQQIRDWRNNHFNSSNTQEGLKGIAVQQSGSFVFQISSIHFDVVLFTMTDPYGLNWGSVIAIPKRWFAQEVVQTSISSVVVFVVVLFLGLILLMTVVQWIQMALRGIKRQLKELVKFSVKSEKQEDWKSSFSLLYDIRQMQQCLNMMRFGLRIFSKYIPELVVQHWFGHVDNNKMVTSPHMYGSAMILNIHGFTLLAEKTNRVNFISQSTDLFSEIYEIIDRNKGMIDKHLGNRLVVVWNEANNSSMHQELACRTAIQIRERMQFLNSKWKTLNYPNVAFTCSVNSGEFLSGNSNSRARVNFTVLGDALNIASSLEELNHALRTQILIGETTFEKVKSRMVCYFVDNLTVKERNKPIKVYYLETCMSEATPNQLEIVQHFQEIEKCFSSSHFSRIIDICESMKSQQLMTSQMEGIVEYLKQRALKKIN